MQYVLATADIDEKAVELFNDEAIKAIIQYKWYTYGKPHFFKLMRRYFWLLAFWIFLAIWQQEMLNGTLPSWLIPVLSVPVFLLLLLFLHLELIQLAMNGMRYLEDVSVCWQKFFCAFFVVVNCCSLRNTKCLSSPCRGP
eukprot:SAG11_NODE_7992_length_1072_cov_1.494347_1_plen_140_part_00